MKRAADKIETDRLVLRQFRAGDHEAYARMCADPEVMRYIGAGGPNDADMSWRSMAGMIGHWALLGYGQWAVERRSDGVLLGRAGFFDPPGWPGFELGYLFGKAHWGQGYAREAAAAALHVAREDLQKARIISLVRPGNAASIKLATALGARFETALDFMGGETNVYVY